jgi:hypothetical protein
MLKALIPHQDHLEFFAVGRSNLQQMFEKHNFLDTCESSWFITIPQKTKLNQKKTQNTTDICQRRDHPLFHQKVIANLMNFSFDTRYVIERNLNAI